MPCLQDLVTQFQIPPSVITIQETKLSATKSTKHIENLFPHYKFFLNNTHKITLKYDKKHNLEIIANQTHQLHKWLKNKDIDKTISNNSWTNPSMMDK